ncbi:ABC transporter substrate-binding protein [Amycolatopsis pigmentata]|uniref:ABC transporter substrate-binding protein n=1 Tax=Amycolatopsis pigmentata TaxID=450801 RepID=A0ABW5FIU2_9PSEU
MSTYRNEAARDGRSSTLKLRTAAAIGTLLALGLIGCGTSGSQAGSGSQADSGSCKGEPIKLMTIFSLSGPLATTKNEVPTAASVAAKALNRTCAGGRPVAITVCDDQSSANGSVLCGNKARSNGTLALIGFTAGAGSSDQGAQTANLPAFFTTNQTGWDNTSKLSYPSNYPLLGVTGQVKVAKALDKKSFTLTAVDVPPAHVQAQIASDTAKAGGIAFHELYFPLTTTDFASVAAQLVSSGTESVDPLVIQPQQFVKALYSAGFDPSKSTIIADEGIITPDQKKTLATELNGAYEVGGIIPASTESNAGIRQMTDEYKAAGESFSPQISTYAVQEWTAVHAFGEALKGLEKAKIEKLSSDSAIDAVVSHGEYALPTLAPFDFSSGNPFPATSPLGQGRVFSKAQQVFAIKDGISVPVGSFQSVTGDISAHE